MINRDLINLLSRFPWNATVSVEITCADAAKITSDSGVYVPSGQPMPNEAATVEIHRIKPEGCNLHAIQIELVPVK